MEAASGRAPDVNERQDDNAGTVKVEELVIANADASDSIRARMALRFSPNCLAGQFSCGRPPLTSDR